MVASHRSPDRLGAVRVARGRHGRADPWLRIDGHGVSGLPLAGQPGHGRRASLRRQPAGIVEAGWKAVTPTRSSSSAVSAVITRMLATDRSKTMSDADVELGPVDYVVVAFPAGQADFSGEMASELRALMDSGTVRVLDLVLLTKDVDGSVEASELRDADDSEVGQLRAALADLAVLLAESDVEEIGSVLEPGSTAAVLVWENSWAAPFGSAVRRSGGQLVTSGRIPTQAIMAAIEADRVAQAEGA